MSQLRDLLLGSDGNAVVDRLANSFGLEPDRTRAAVEELIPALSRGLQRNTRSGPGMDALLEALRTGKHARYMDEPSLLDSDATRRDGNDILGHVFGTKDVSREVARRASTRSGVPDSVLKKMLPVLATVAMGMLGKKVLGGDGAPAVTRRASAGGLLASLLDSDRDGSVWDDVLGMAARGLLR